MQYDADLSSNFKATPVDVSNVNFDHETSVGLLAYAAYDNISDILSKAKADRVELSRDMIILDGEFLGRRDGNNSGDQVAGLLNKYTHFNKLPIVMSEKDFGKFSYKDIGFFDINFLKNNIGLNGVTLCRGINSSYTISLTSAEMTQTFKTGTFFDGYGATGNGTCASPWLDGAARYAFPRWAGTQGLWFDNAN